MDPGFRDRDAPRGADRVARADRPAVLDERDRGGGVVRDGLLERPELLLGRELAAFGPRRVEPDQRAERRACALAGEVGMVQAPDDTVRALLNDEELHGSE